MHGDDQYGKLRCDGLDVFDEFQPVLVREREVGQHQIGLVADDPFKRLRGILRLAANDHVRLVVDQIRKSAARHRMIINDQDARLFRTLPGLFTVFS